jgi:hypothetical protein
MGRGIVDSADSDERNAFSGRPSRSSLAAAFTGGGVFVSAIGAVVAGAGNVAVDSGTASAAIVAIVVIAALKTITVVHLADIRD